MNDMKIKFISKNKDGNYYIGYTIPVQRGMGHQKVEELIIIGMHKDEFPRFCKEHNIIIKGEKE